MSHRQRWGLVAMGIAVVLVGVFLPREWYDALPWPSRLPVPPVKGVTLLQGAFVLEGLLLAAVGWFGIRPAWGAAAGAQGEWRGEDQADVSGRTALIALAAITALGLLLRLIRLNSDLWLDEITPVIQYRDFSALEVVATYLRSNNHLLNTLLVKLATAAFGEREWAIRLPAMLFGAATVPVLYWVARLAMTRVAALSAALLLAVSYHHIFFSQNARGYSAYLCLTLIATGCLVRGLQRDRPAAWVGYVVAMVANFAALLHSAFVIMAHLLIGAGVLWRVRRRGENAAPLLRRLIAVFAVVGILGFHLYATMLPQAYVVITNTYRSGTSGFFLTSAAFATDVIKGLGEGFQGGWWLLAPGAALALYGFGRLLRREWTLAAALALPPVLTFVLLMARHLSASPRFFLIGLPLADLAVVLGVTGLVRGVLRRWWDVHRADWAATAVLAVLAVASLAALPAYYRTPKQAYRAALAYVTAERAPGDVIVLVQNAEQGFRFYATRAGLQEGKDFVAVRSVEALDAVERSRGASHMRLVTTFRRALRLGEPELYARIEAGWTAGRRFPGTVHDGSIMVWDPNGR